ncbi:MAG: hypothetical protein ACOCP9_02270 [Halofilum sp. (in: g-proteobacteria)]
MRTFLALGILAGICLWAALRTPRTELYLRILRAALFAGAGIFGALLVSAILQALFAGG